MPIVTDSVRQADEDNPNGYFEVELTKNLKDGKKEWIYDAQGGVIKMISYLLEYLPEDLTYYIVFMERDLVEILASQRKMLERRNEKSEISDDEMETRFKEHLQAVKPWLARKSNMHVLYVKYSDLVSTPDAICNSIARFLNVSLNLSAMQSVPNQSLYRNRSKKE